MNTDPYRIFWDDELWLARRLILLELLVFDDARLIRFYDIALGARVGRDAGFRRF